jgi:nanoRNase/pAp phosphatase (c-di-AMP/oligoRNAs hydrolase)
MSETPRIYRVNRQSTRTRFSELEETLNLYKGKTIAIDIQRVPDPDALASAYFLKIIAQLQGIRADITHAGLISHTSNRMMIQQLGLETKLYGDTNPEKYDGFFFVDQSGNTSPWYLEGKIPESKLIGIIDHHDLDKQTPNIPFTDKRHVGATASIIAEYLQQGAEEKIAHHYPDLLPRLKTALCYGILTDTGGDFELATEFDEDQYQFLKRGFDKQMMKEIKNPPIPSSWYDLQARAIRTRVSKEKETIAFVGVVKPEDRDVIPITADYLLREGGIETVYVIGIHDDARDNSIIDVSIRTKKSNFNYEKPTSFFEKAVGGGRNGAGGIQAPNPFDTDERNYLDQMVREKLHYERILRQFGFEIPNNLDELFPCPQK